MHPAETMTRIVNRTRHDVSKAELLAGDDYWDGHNFERSGRQRFLYRTPRGNYFTVSLSQWQGEQDTLDPVDIDDAILLYEGPLSEHRVEYEAAFPDVEVEDA